MLDDAPLITVTTTDHDRLERLLESNVATEPVATQLREELDRARIVEPEEVPPDVVTMNSRVVVEDEQTRERMEIALVYPGQARVEENRISVLAPVGAALLGLRTGQTIRWPMPNGRTKVLKVVAVPYQPEAQGHAKS